MLWICSNEVCTACCTTSPQQVASGVWATLIPARWVIVQDALLITVIVTVVKEEKLRTILRENGVNINKNAHRIFGDTRLACNLVYFRVTLDRWYGKKYSLYFNLQICKLIFCSSFYGTLNYLLIICN